MRQPTHWLFPRTIIIIVDHPNMVIQTSQLACIPEAMATILYGLPTSHVASLLPLPPSLQPGVIMKMCHNLKCIYMVLIQFSFCFNPSQVPGLISPIDPAGLTLLIKKIPSFAVCLGGATCHLPAWVRQLTSRLSLSLLSLSLCLKSQGLCVPEDKGEKGVWHLIDIPRTEQVVIKSKKRYHRAACFRQRLWVGCTLGGQ